MKYLKADNQTVLKYPYTLRDAKRDYPNISFPSVMPGEDTLAVFNVYPVEPTPKPTGDVVTEGTPELQSGLWVQTWNVRDYTQAELDAMAASEAESTARESVIADNQVRALLKATPAQIDAYVDANVTSLASAKVALATLARAVSILAQDLLRQEPAPDTSDGT